MMLATFQHSMKCTPTAAQALPPAQTALSSCLVRVRQHHGLVKLPMCGFTMADTIPAYKQQLRGHRMHNLAQISCSYHKLTIDSGHKT